MPVESNSYKYRHKAPKAKAAKSELKTRDQVKKEKKRMKKLQAKMKSGRSFNKRKPGGKK